MPKASRTGFLFFIVQQIRGRSSDVRGSRSRSPPAEVFRRSSPGPSDLFLRLRPMMAALLPERIFFDPR